MNEIIEKEPQIKATENGQNSTNFNLQNLSLLAASFVAFSLFMAMSAQGPWAQGGNDYIRNLFFNFFPWIIGKIIGNSWTIGVIIFTIGLLLDEKHKSIRIPSILTITGLGLSFINEWFRFLEGPTIWFTDLFIHIPMLVIMISLVIHGKRSETKSVSILPIIFIAIFIVKIVFLKIGFGDGDYLVYQLSYSLNFDFYNGIFGTYYYNSLYLFDWGINICMLGLILTYRKKGILTIGGIISNSFKLGFGNLKIFIITIILWILTIWIPYLNVGTTIAMLGIVIFVSKGGTYSPTQIFSAKYRENMGEFFLLLSFMIIGIASGYAFVIVPGIVISIAWSQSIFLLIDKGFNPIEAIKISNKITYREKITIFIGYLSLFFVLGLCVAICTVIAVSIWERTYRIPELLAFVFWFVTFIGTTSVMIGCSAYIYGELNKKLTTE